MRDRYLAPGITPSPATWATALCVGRDRLVVVLTAAVSLQAPQLRFSVAPVAVGLAWVVRAWLLPDAGDRSPFLALGLAVLVSAIVGGIGPGLMAVGLSSAVAVYLYLPPHQALAVHEPFDGALLCLFVLEGLVATVAGGLMRSNLGRTAATNRAMEEPAVSLEHARIVRLQRPATGHTPLEGLTRREREVARLLAHGLSNDEIAAALYVSRNTVKTHLKHVYGKLEVRTRTQAVSRCIGLGLLDGETMRSEASLAQDRGAQDRGAQDRGSQSTRRAAAPGG
jgi:DNA-binding CsgD family transcriptional regulator